ncbi:MAG: phenylalanine--tRNA ligase subunit beta [Phycisphaerales bacterium JB064]
MDASLTWLASLVGAEGADSPLTVEEVDAALTAAGFPLDGVEPKGDDALLDVEVTSNRGDCLCHLGLAREIAAMTGRVLSPREIGEVDRGPAVGDHLTLVNECAGGERPACPTFTAHVILGATIGPSPAWLKDLLESVGQRSINNAVDVTNWLNLEHGNPSHVFDLDRLEGRRLVIREAAEGETLTTLDGVSRKLRGGEVVVADGSKATSLAGVIGGKDSEVSQGTTNIVLEVATWDPARVRAASRAHAVRTDASHRFERVVDPRTCLPAAEMAARLIAQLTGGTLCEGVLVEGAPMPEARAITLRPQRCAAVLGIETPADEIVRLLRSVDIAVGVEGDALACTPPPQRAHDVVREIDLIEEIARLRGFDAVPLARRLAIKAQPPQPAEQAMGAITSALTALGFYEAVTFSFTGPDKATPFLPSGASLVNVDDDRRGAEPTLRPSVLPSLLTCRRVNRDAQVHQPGGVRLFEVAATYWSMAQGSNEESRRLAMLVDAGGEGAKASAEDVQQGVRVMKAAIEAMAALCVGHEARVRVELGGELPQAMDAANSGRVLIEPGAGKDAVRLGYIGLPTKETLALFDLQRPVIVAELDVVALLTAYPPTPRVRSLPAFPGIERDLSVVVPAATPWASIESAVLGLGLERLQSVAFVGTYAGKQVGEGRKSVTLRMAYRDDTRTMRHEEVDPQMARAVEALREAVGAEVRG